jgi:adenine-specific DNA-methyltransferase
MVTNREENLIAKKDKYRAFFTDEKNLSSYMVSLLSLQPEDAILEPASGRGDLIDAVLHHESRVSVTAYEIQPDYVDILEKKFTHLPNVSIFPEDTLTSNLLDLREKSGSKFTKIIGNPPYGGWQDYPRRNQLRHRYTGFYVKETYTLFLLRCLNLLADDGILVFIIPATFLQLHLHAPLRRYLLENFQVNSIDLFPSSFFSGVSFGYADLCIISISAKKCSSTHNFRLRYIDKAHHLNNPESIQNKSHLIRQSSIMEALDFAFPHPKRTPAFNVHQYYGLRMSDVANCVTGFYSGADTLFLRATADNLRGLNRYKLIDHNQIAQLPLGPKETLEGIEGQKTFIPVLKGGGYPFVKPVLWFVDWSKTAVNHYKTNKKARFQNASFYLKKGIGFPMVTSSKPTAAIIEDCLFDQSIVGIFPKRLDLFYYLLAYCNSSIFWSCLKALNPTANNSARYILKTPVFIPSENVVKHISQKTKSYIVELKNTRVRNEDLQKEIDTILTQELRNQAHTE